MTRKSPARKTAKSHEDEPIRRPRFQMWQGALVLLILAAAFGILNLSGVLDLGLGSWGGGGDQTIRNPEARLAPFYSPSVARWSDDIYRWAREYGVNPNVIAIVIQIESCGDVTAISGAGALGLMQVMPFHFDNGRNMLNPDTNVEYGMGVFYECLMQFAGGDLGLALACYNGGPGVTLRDRSTWAAETRHYYDWATGLWSDVVHGRSESETLKSWLAAGGQRLCDHAENQAAS